MTKYRVAIDIGGTFTDLVALNGRSGEFISIKIPSTPTEPARAVIKAFQEFQERTSSSEVSIIVHATTIATNALLGQLSLELPKTALVTTKGYRDVVEIGRQRRHALYDLFIKKPRVLIPRRLRYGVEERIGPKGEVLTSLNKDQVESLATMLEKERVRSVAVALLFSYVNRKHEQEIGKILRKKLPRTYISLSSEIAPEYREFERTSTTVVNAVLAPIVSGYLDELQRKIRKLEVKTPLCVMQSDGGISSERIVVRKPVSMVESGPAAGVVASAFYGNLLETENILSFDMGGTTAKAGLVREAAPEVVSEYEVAGKIHSGRIVKGSGYPVRYPFIDLAECSAGGGTIAWVDEGGALQVGSISAGAEPGPACYGQGGEQPTITDANILLGRLNSKYLLGGRMKIYRELAEKAILDKICRRMHLGLAEAAAGIIQIANSAMAKILRIVSVERGYDPRDFVLMCFGGAGPMHGCHLAEELKITKMIVPPNPGLFSTYGLLAADFRNHLSKAIIKLTSAVDAKKVETIFKRLELQGVKLLERQHVPEANMQFISQVDLRYFGQSYELTIPTPRPFTGNGLDQTVERFHEKHRAVYGYAVKRDPVEVVNVELIAVGLVEKPVLKRRHTCGEKPSEKAIIAERKVFFENTGYIETSVFEREDLTAGNLIEGPAVVEQYDSTTIIYPDWVASVDEFENIVLTMKN